MTDMSIIIKVNFNFRNEDKLKKEYSMEKNNRFNGIWGNGAFKIKIKGNSYVSFYNNSRYGKGTLIFDNEKFVLTSSHARYMFFWRSFIESVKGKYLIEIDALTVSGIEGRYSDFNGKWVRLKK
jgi:hypothetical protein